MEPFPDLSDLTDDALSERLNALVREEDEVSIRRRDLHGRIDMLREEYVRRVKASLADGEAPGIDDGSDPGRALFEGTGELPPPHDLGPAPDLPALGTDELRFAIRELDREEDDVSLRRRVLHGQIDILRAERYRRLRGESGVAPADLASILTHGSPDLDAEGA